MPIKHKFVSPKTDDPDDTLVRPSDWNDDHDGSGGLNGEVTGVAAAIPSGTGTNIQWSTEANDDDDMVDLAANNTRITCQRAGVVMVTFAFQAQSHNSGNRIASVQKNGSNVSFDSAVSVTALNDPRMNGSYTGRVIAGDFFTINYFQNSGANNTPTNARFSVTLIPD